HRFYDTKPLLQFIFILIAMIAAIIFGGTLGLLISSYDPAVFLQIPTNLLEILVLGLLFGAVGSYFFISREKIAATETQAREEKIRRLVSEKAAAEAQLKQLQAQIEPHFLFNTLSNVLSMLDSDPQKGKPCW
ncbi:MAG: hypothetical protein DRQ39_10505, partial [Gammaproteobacteria bacterium]